MIHRTLKYMKLDALVRPIKPIGAWYLRVSPRMITCREFNDFIIDYTEGNLTEEQSILFKRHMRVCPMCRNFLRTYIATYKAADRILPYDDTEVPSEVPQDLIDAILDIKQSKKGD